MQWLRNLNAKKEDDGTSSRGNVLSWCGDPLYDVVKGVHQFIREVKLDTSLTTEFGAGIPNVDSFNTFLDACQDMPLAGFKSTFCPKPNQYVEKLSFNPVRARFFEQFMDPSKRPPNSHYKHDDLSLSPKQIEAFKKNGFVVTSSEVNWARAYYKIYNNDLPVFISADSILHAFHMSFDDALTELETDYCASTLETILKGMRAQLNVEEFSQGPFHQSLQDADVFLTVALNLLNAEAYYREGSAADPNLNKQAPEPVKKSRYLFGPTPPKGPQAQIPTIFGDEAKVDLLLAACHKEQAVQVKLFGVDREFDFTLMKPRGHYTAIPSLRQYFRAMTWLGKIDMRLVGEEATPRQLGAAVVLHMLVKNDQKVEDTFRLFNKTIDTLIGAPNSMDFHQLDVLLNSIFKLKSYSELNSEEALTTLLQKIAETNLGAKKYNAGKKSPSQVFTLIGQRFTIDSWATAKMIYDEVHWHGQEVQRNRTSAVEIAFSILENNDAAPILHDRIADTQKAREFRDGLNYHPNLVAARKTIDSLPHEAWFSSVYTNWLYALRKLSAPTDERFPQVLRTQAYSMKRMATQLGSWAQLRHDTILYVEQLSRFTCSCEYPEGYVEPYVDFWKAMENLCLATSAAMHATVIETEDYRKKNQQTNRVQFFLQFAKVVHILREISELELAQKPLNEQLTTFMRYVMEKESIGSGGEVGWTGWYPTLFYRGEESMDKEDLIVSDVYTNPPDPEINDPGCVLHQGLGLPRRMLVAVDNGKDVCVYAGPVYDYYEFELKGRERLNDEGWKAKVKAGQTPPPPEWTASYLVPN